jgi:hypothetical protein
VRELYAALCFSGVRSNAFTGQFIVRGHGWFMRSPLRQSLVDRHAARDAMMRTRRPRGWP